MRSKPRRDKEWQTLRKWMQFPQDVADIATGKHRDVIQRALTTVAAAWQNGSATSIDMAPLKLQEKRFALARDVWLVCRAGTPPAPGLVTIEPDAGLSLLGNRGAQHVLRALRRLEAAARWASRVEDARLRERASEASAARQALDAEATLHDLDSGPNE